LKLYEEQNYTANSLKSNKFINYNTLLQFLNKAKNKSKLQEIDENITLHESIIAERISSCRCNNIELAKDYDYNRSKNELKNLNNQKNRVIQFESTITAGLIIAAATIFANGIFNASKEIFLKFGFDPIASIFIGTALSMGAIIFMLYKNK